MSLVPQNQIGIPICCEKAESVLGDQLGLCEGENWICEFRIGCISGIWPEFVDYWRMMIKIIKIIMKKEIPVVDQMVLMDSQLDCVGDGLKFYRLKFPDYDPGI
ncbi:MAG: hypothetical protein EZS28_051989 [Streblomastix strix]|uniref:Uncharacterized protein n=1 Tax=Streblomastix strix TaxID=222440 RepID=A0A5J4SSI9_9EUKA|nr:MAG: hypothetical protein EZS28_051989 [Streblomastix strix]